MCSNCTCDSKTEFVTMDVQQEFLKLEKEKVEYLRKITTALESISRTVNSKNLHPYKPNELWK